MFNNSFSSKYLLSGRHISLSGNYLYFTILFLSIIVILSILFFKKQYRLSCDAKETKYYLDIDESNPRYNYNVNIDNQVRYIFWTGGYDSTFLLIQALVIEGYPVQPIYIKCTNLDEKFGINGRYNQREEIKTMKEIRRKIIERYPECEIRFLPTMYVYSIKKDNDVSQKFKNIHNNFSYFSRDVTQYERMARLSLNLDKNIEVGLEKCGTGLDEATKGIRILEGSKHCQIDMSKLVSIEMQDFDIFKNFRFPIVHLSKEECKNIALKQKNYDILQLTWTCWHPDNGKQCGKCPQCIKRIL